MLTTNKIATGEFEVLWNGEKTDWRIINGSRGVSGRDTQNVYGIVNDKTGKHRWIGTLQACKKCLNLTFKKQNG